MSTELDTELDMGFNTKANPYLVCFCDERNECTCCEKHDYHTTGSLGGALNKAGKLVKGVGTGNIGESIDEKAIRKHAKRQKKQNSTQFKLWQSVTSDDPTARGLFTKEAFHRFEVDFNIDHSTLKEMPFEEFKTREGMKALADKMVADGNLFKKKLTYDQAMEEMSKTPIYQQMHAIQSWQKTHKPSQAQAHQHQSMFGHHAHPEPAAPAHAPEHTPAHGHHLFHHAEPAAAAPPHPGVLPHMSHHNAPTRNAPASEPHSRFSHILHHKTPAPSVPANDQTPQHQRVHHMLTSKINRDLF